MTNGDAQTAVNSMEGYLHDCRVKMGKSIREIREKKGYNQEQLAEIMKVSRTTISKIENLIVDGTIFRYFYRHRS